MGRISGRSIGEPLSGGGEVANAVSFSPSGKLLASADGAVIRLWDIASGRLLRKPLTGHTGTVNDIVFNAQGTLLASSGIDSTVRLWEVPSGHPHGPPLTGHFATANSVDGYAGAIEQIAFSPDGTLLASAGDDTTARLWKPEFESWVTYGCRIVNRNLSND